MKKLHFDITILEDSLAFGHKEIGIKTLELLKTFIENKYTIVIERRPTDEAPIIINVLKKEDSDKFMNHWQNQFKNLNQ